MKPDTTSSERLTLPAVDVLDLDVTGMTCASCAARIERKLNKLEGVTASVNYATEKARVDVGATGLSVDDLIATIESVGYGARIHTTAGAADDTLVRLRRRLVVAVALGLPVLLLSMIPALQFDGWQWVALVLATPVATWAAWPFHRAMVLNLARMASPARPRRQGRRRARRRRYRAARADRRARGRRPVRGSPRREGRHRRCRHRGHVGDRPLARHGRERARRGGAR